MKIFLPGSLFSLRQDGKLRRCCFLHSMAEGQLRLKGVRMDVYSQGGNSVRPMCKSRWVRSV